jgi:multidrug efflux pump subunit AcrB
LLLPEGTAVEATEQKVAETERLLGVEKGIASYASYVGEGSPRFYYNFTPEAPASNVAQIVVNTASIEAASEMIPRLQRAINTEIDGATITVKRLAQGPPVGAPIAIRLSGSRVEDLRDARRQVMSILRSVPGYGLFWDDYHEDRVVSKLDIDQERARDAGVSPVQVAAFANLAYSGHELTRFREGDRELPVVMELDQESQSASRRIEDIYLPSENTRVVRLGDIARVSLQGVDARIVRRNGVRTLTIFGYSDGSRSDLAVFEEAWSKLQNARLPGDVKASYAGDKLERELSFGEIAAVSAVGVAFNILVVAWLFPNWRIVLAITAATPLSLIGGVLGLWVTHQPFGFMAVLGIVSLGGVITNHTIVLFQYALQEQRIGLTVKDAIVAAGAKRFRPILLTVLLSIMGLIPQSLNGGSLWPPLANALIFGLMISLFITLIVVPSIYALLTREPRRPLLPPTSVSLPTKSEMRKNSPAANVRTGRC